MNKFLISYNVFIRFKLDTCQKLNAVPKFTLFVLQLIFSENIYFKVNDDKNVIISASP